MCDTKRKKIDIRAVAKVKEGKKVKKTGRILRKRSIRKGRRKER